MTSLSPKNICGNSLEIQQDAKNLIDKFGDEAASKALENMQDLIERDDAKAAQRWLAVAHEIGNMESHRVN